MGVDVEGSDLGSYVKDLQQQVAQKVPLPAGYTIEWGGPVHNMERALRHLMIIVPITVATIFFLLFVLFKSVRYAALITVLPLASIGGIVALWGMRFARGPFGCSSISCSSHSRRPYTMWWRMLASASLVCEISGRSNG